VVLKRVLDTNAILHLLGGKPGPTSISGTVLRFRISEMELLSYPSLDAESLTQIRGFLSEVTLVGLSEEVRELAVGLRRQHRLKLPDAIVAATALSLQAQLITNDANCSGCPGWRVSVWR